LYRCLTYSDPFGLCPEELKQDTKACALWNAKQAADAKRIVDEERARGNEDALPTGPNEQIEAVNESDLPQHCPTSPYGSSFSDSPIIYVNADRNAAAISGTIVHERQHRRHKPSRRGPYTEPCAQRRGALYVYGMSDANKNAATSGHLPETPYPPPSGTKQNCSF
jgi:hypothetical protein